VSPTLYLINDDEPSQFPPRTVTVVSRGVRVGSQDGLVVTIDPPIENTPDGPLSAAVLVPRHRDVRVEELHAGAMRKSASVFVCRFTGNAEDLPKELTKDDLPIAFWGRLYSSPDSE
jgi:hypothetical protein